MAQRQETRRPNMFSRIFRRTSPSTNITTPHAHAPSSQGGIGGFFRRIFRRGPSVVHVQPFRTADSPEPVERARVVPIVVDLRRESGFYHSSLSFHSAATEPEADAPDQPSQNLLETAASRSLARFRDELLEALAMVLLDQREVEIAEQELNQLRRYFDIMKFEQDVNKLESDYDSFLCQLLPDHVDEEEPLYDIEGKLILARLLLSVETISMALMAARHRHGDASVESLQLAVCLEVHVQLLSSSCDREPELRMLMAHERAMGLRRIANACPSAACPFGRDVVQRAMRPLRPLPHELQALYDQMLNRPRLPEDFKESDLKFRIKCQELKFELLKLRNSGKLEVCVARDNIVVDSVEALMRASSADLKRRLFVKFQGEDGNDFGGLSREWFSQLSQGTVLAAVQQGLLVPSANDVSVLQISPMTRPKPASLKMFEFMGRVVGLAIFHGKITEFNFVLPFYKYVLGGAPMLGDLLAIDAEYHASLVHLLDNTGVEDLMLTFSIDYQENGVLQTHELLPGGEDTAVTDANKGQYVDLVVKWRLCRSISRQIESFRRGLMSVVGVDFLREFTPEELGLITRGMGRVDIAEWKSHTTYENGYSEESSPIVWFWQALASFSQPKQCLVLRFVTGSARPPAQGFAALSGTSGSSLFSIYRNDGVHALPVGHTCINRLDLPAYTSYETLVSKLTLAIEETEGFGIV